MKNIVLLIKYFNFFIIFTGFTENGGGNREDGGFTVGSQSDVQNYSVLEGLDTGEQTRIASGETQPRVQNPGGTQEQTRRDSNVEEDVEEERTYNELINIFTANEVQKERIQLHELLISYIRDVDNVSRQNLLIY